MQKKSKNWKPWRQTKEYQIAKANWEKFYKRNEKALIFYFTRKKIKEEKEEEKQINNDLVQNKEETETPVL